MKTVKELGKFLKKARHDRRMSQLELAKRMGFDCAQSISNWERGLTLPTKSRLDVLCSELAIPKSMLVEMMVQAQRERILQACA